MKEPPSEDQFCENTDEKYCETPNAEFSAFFYLSLYPSLRCFFCGVVWCGVVGVVWCGWSGVVVKVMEVMEVIVTSVCPGQWDILM